MGNASEPVSVRLLDREYTVGVEPGERDSLMAAARLLETKMREIRGGNRMAAVDRIAVLAASRDRELARVLDGLQRRLDGLGA